MSSQTTNYNLITNEITDPLSTALVLNQESTMDIIDSELKKAQDHRESTSAHTAQDITYSGNISGASQVKNALDDVQTQITAITIGAGTSPAEVTASRAGITGEANSTLKERLDTMESNIGKVTNVSSDTTLTYNHRGTIKANTASNNITLTLPDATTTRVMKFIVTKTSSNYALILDGYSSQTIGGKSQILLSKLNDSIEILNDGSNWIVVSNNILNNGKINIINYSNNTTIYDGITSAVNAINLALADIPNGGTLYFPYLGNGIYLIDSNLSLASHPKICIEFEAGAMLSISDTKTFIGNNTIIEFRDKQIFDLNTSGTLTGSFDLNEVDSRMFGVNNSNDDNYTNIVNACTFAQTIGVSTVLLPKQTIKTSCINFMSLGFNNLILKGTSSYGYADRDDLYNGTIVKIIAAGNVALQFASQTNPYVGYDRSSTFTAMSCRVKDIFVDCNNLANYGINGNFDFECENVVVKRAIYDGFVAEDYSYPYKLKNCTAYGNGRHGFWARGKYTTVYSLSNCEMSVNSGYGMLLEGGANVVFDRVTIQSNTKGGVKVNKKNTYSGGYFLNDLTFNNLYCEDNGHSGGEGDYGVLITAETINGDMANMCPHITFNGGSINESTSGKALGIDLAFGLTLNMTSVDTTKIDINHTSYCEGLVCAPGGTGSDIGGALPYPFNAKYVQRVADSKILEIIPRGGIVGMRGRTVLLNFSLPSITSGTTVVAYFNNGLTSGSWINGFPMHGSGSLLSMQIYHKLSTASRGTLTLTPSYNLISNMSSASETLPGFPTLALAAETEQQKLANYLPMAYPIDSTYIFGFKITASADYVAGDYGQIVAFAILEM